MSGTPSYDSLLHSAIASFGPSGSAGSGVPSDIPMGSFMSEIGEFTIPLFVGTVMNWALLGTLVVQVYIYYLAFPKDRRFWKIAVAFVAVAEFLQTLANSRDNIRVFGSGWGNPEILNDIGWAWFSAPIMGSFIASVNQMFFAWRIYIIAQTLYVPIIIALATAFQFAAGIWTGVTLFRAKQFSALRFIVPPVAWLSATALSDLIIVSGMVFYLLKAREPEFTRQTKATVSRIIKVTVETGLFCALAAIVVLSLCVAFLGDFHNYYLAIGIWLSKVYSNSIMIILNSRAHIGHEPTAPGATTKMIEMTEVVFNSSVGPTSTIQSSMQARNIMADDDPDDSALEPKGSVVKHRSEMVA
ncbi:hypothetical protein MSAN_01725500 [Mycena sanguinolenta]|uniref:DUF6534 domain-containing protein n=1 Tax=Mycena sanguinolenta TaxID=230812 RepID=A0A8H6XZY8_9AGAR|nr:hypothetical protein MSAN_01725500 [Mycena sanguinolenta]